MKSSVLKFCSHEAYFSQISESLSALKLMFEFFLLMNGYSVSLQISKNASHYPSTPTLGKNCGAWCER